MSRTVLTIDDSRTMREMLRATLSSQGFIVVQAEDGAHGIEVLEGMEVEPDVIITDINNFIWKKNPNLTSDMDGAETGYRRWLNAASASLRKIDGGLGVPDILSQVEAIQAMWVVRYMGPSNASWKPILDHWLVDSKTAHHGRDVLLTSKKAQPTRALVSPLWIVADSSVVFGCLCISFGAAAAVVSCEVVYYLFPVSGLGVPCRLCLNLRCSLWEDVIVCIACSVVGRTGTLVQRSVNSKYLCAPLDFLPLFRRT